MKVTGSHVLNQSPETVWALLQQPGVLSRVVPGCERMEAVDEQEYRFAVRQRIGPIDDTFTGTLFFTDIVPGERFTLTMNAESPSGMARGHGIVSLEPVGERSTVLDYAGDLVVGGRLTVVTARLLETTTNAIVRRTMSGLEDECLDPVSPYAAAALGASPVNGAQAIAVAPSNQRTRTIVAGLGALGAAGLLVWRILDNRRIDRIATAVVAQMQAEQTDID